MKRIHGFRFWALGILMVLILMATAIAAGNTTDFDYKTALKYSIYFYDGNKCGKNVAKDNVFKWRKACHVKDGSDVKRDLTGGFHDAGDHVKFGLPQGYAASVLGWSLLEYKDVFDSTGLTPKLLSTLKYFSDYFLKCHPKPELFYYQIGSAPADHRDWMSPEYQREPRPTYAFADPEHPASDVCGMTAAALSLMYLNYKPVNQGYAKKCLKAAKELYVLGKNYKGFSNSQNCYPSNSYNDDLAWGAFWLYQIEKDPAYLSDIEKYLSEPSPGGDPLKSTWTMSWGDMYLPVTLKMAQMTGEAKYKDGMAFNLSYWQNDLKTTPGGLKYLDVWGVCRYAAAESMIALLYYEQTRDESLKTFAKSQIDYILGNNPAKLSYIAGFGSNYPKQLHHRALTGYQGYQNNMNDPSYTLIGALVGGPNEEDVFKDNSNFYQYTEVAIDYNAGLVGALAGMVRNFGK